MALPCLKCIKKTDFKDGNSPDWNFSSYTPKIVSIALGTNDFSNGDGKKERLPFDSIRFVEKYIEFIQIIKSTYPAAQIALLSSPMLIGKAREKLQGCLEAVKTQVDKLYPTDKPVALFFFDPMQAKGCTGHPSVEDHAILAKQLRAFFERLLK